MCRAKGKTVASHRIFGPCKQLNSFQSSSTQLNHPTQLNSTQPNSSSRRDALPPYADMLSYTRHTLRVGPNPGTCRSGRYKTGLPGGTGVHTSTRIGSRHTHAAHTAYAPPSVPALHRDLPGQPLSGRHDSLLSTRFMGPRPQRTPAGVESIHLRV